MIENDVPLSSEWVGTLVGYINAQIRSRVSGYLVSQKYKEGSPVKTGDLLFEIDPRPFQNAGNGTTAKLRQAESQVVQAKSQVTEAQSQLSQATAMVAQTEAEVKKAEALQRKTELDVARYTALAQRGSISQQELEDSVQLATDCSRYGWPATTRCSRPSSSCSRRRARWPRSGAIGPSPASSLQGPRGRLEPHRGAVGATRRRGAAVDAW